MNLDPLLLRLPLRYDAGRLRAEVDALPAEAWIAARGAAPGSILPLLAEAPAGEGGGLQASAALEASDYLRQVLASFGAPLGPCWLERVRAGDAQPPRLDAGYPAWRQLRLRVVVASDPPARFLLGEQAATLAAGECWALDGWQPLQVEAPTGSEHIHLVLNLPPSLARERLLDAARSAQEAVAVDYAPGQQAALPATEHPLPVVMPPAELAALVQFLLDELGRVGVDRPRRQAVAAALQALRLRWSQLWQRFAATEAGWPQFSRLLQEMKPRLARIPPLVLGNGLALHTVLERWLTAALNPGRADAGHRVAMDQPRPPLPALPPAPVFVVGAPRSGVMLVHEALAQACGAVTAGGDGGVVIDGLPALSPAAHDWHSQQLGAEDATAETVQAVQQRWLQLLRDPQGRPWTRQSAPRPLVDGSPRHALRIGFLAAAFPDARFLYVVREPMATVSSILEAWRSGRFVSFEKLPDWDGGRWSLPLIPGWRALRQRSLAEVAAAQYQATQAAILEELAALPRARWHAVEHDAFLADPPAALAAVAQWAGLALERWPSQPLPVSPGALSAPNPDKWRRNAALLEPLRPALADTEAAIAAATGIHTGLASAASDGPDRQADTDAADGQADAVPVEPSSAPLPTAAPGPRRVPAAAPVASDPATRARQAQQKKALASVHTRSFVEVLERAAASLLVSTYQAGKLVLVRRQGEVVNTGFRSLSKPMGIALDGPRLAIGSAGEVRLHGNVPAAAARFPAGSSGSAADAVFLPRASHVTGNIDIHEMAFANGELWIVNTRFCCLCTLDAQHSFVPRWKPPFLSALAPEDRCHLNGLAVRDGRVRYVTMLGQTDTPGGWRANKASGGLLMDLDGERVVVDGLSMPHSPRWYRDQLWVLESGTGGLCRIDPATGHKETLVELPGFTRGLDFIGPLAFIGLSQVRESAVFAMLPLTERLSERNCGVWVVNIDSGEVVAFLRFEDAVQEIFAVTALPGIRHPELVLPRDPVLADTFVLPDAALAAVPAAQRGPA